MFVVGKPSQKKLEEVLQSQLPEALNYPEVGWTKSGASPGEGYYVHATSVQLGFGKATYDRAVTAIRDWRQFDVGFVALFPEKPVLEVGTNLIVCARHFPMWSINTCRIVYLIDEKTEEKERFGFGYGTLPIHSEQGEERFLIEWDQRTDEVCYEILAFSRPNHWLVALLLPATIYIQDSFRFGSLKAMQKALLGASV
jgi:uncharacterized protein (UPF0548 family)